jgi:tetratricopeptide (TPR) repeat protein
VLRLAHTLLLLALMAAYPVLAKEAVVGMSERMYAALQEAQEFLDLEDYDGARAGLEAMLERKITDYERAHALNLIAYTWYEQDRLDIAVQTYERAMALEELPNAMRVTLLNSLGQVNLAGENYAAAERYLRQLLALPDQDVPSNQVLLAAALLGQERYADALEPLLSAVEGERAKGNQPRENWLSMLASIYYEINDYAAMRDVVEELVKLYPREQYVMNLAALHGQLGDQGRQLALIESLLDDERLTQPTHLRMIVNLFLGEEMPHKAAVILERELDSGRLERNLSNLELLSQAWLLSAETENAIEPLAEAAALSESGELYLRLARLHMDAYRFEEADEAARAALKKGGLRREGHAWLLRGMAEVRLKRFTDARRRFEKAAGFKETEKYAGQWLTYLESEAQRAEALSNS